MLELAIVKDPRLTSFRLRGSKRPLIVASLIRTSVLFSRPKNDSVENSCNWRLSKTTVDTLACCVPNTFGGSVNGFPGGIFSISILIDLENSKVLRQLMCDFLNLILPGLVAKIQRIFMEFQCRRP